MRHLIELCENFEQVLESSQAVRNTLSDASWILRKQTLCNKATTFYQ